MAFENNVQATLQANVAIGATTIDVVKAVAPNKDVPVSGRLTLSGTNKTEIITYTGRTDNTTYWTITGVTKDAESSFGDQAWSAGDACYQALTAADVTALSNRQTATRLDFVATAGQATKTDLTYTVGNIDCYLNGSKLTLGTDFTATDGVSVTFAPALTLNDEVQLIMDAGASGSASGGSSAGSVADFVASGVLPNGTPVILKADGTVEAVSISGTTLSESIPLSSGYVFNADSVDYISTAFDPNTANNFVIVFSDINDSRAGKAIVGTISGNSITFGAEYVFNTTRADYPTIAFDPSNANKFVISYRDNDNSMITKVLVGTVSGTSITFGSKYSLHSSGTSLFNRVNFVPNSASKFVVTWNFSGGVNYCKVGTISGTTISFGSDYVINATGITDTPTIAFDPNNVNNFAVCFKDHGNSYYGTAVIGTVSGTAISFGTKNVFNSANTHYHEIAFIPNHAGKFVIAYTDSGNSNRGTTIVATISGNSLSFGAEYVFNSATTWGLSIAPATNANDFGIVYQDSGGTSQGIARTGSISGTSISFGAENVFNSVIGSSLTINFDPNSLGRFLTVYQDSNNSSYGTAILSQLAVNSSSTNITSTNFIGIPDAGYADAATATVTLPAGLSTNQSGLVAGSEYYIQNDGTLSTTAGSPSVLIGKALSATSILLKAY